MRTLVGLIFTGTLVAAPSTTSKLTPPVTIDGSFAGVSLSIANQNAKGIGISADTGAQAAIAGSSTKNEGVIGYTAVSGHNGVSGHGSNGGTGVGGFSDSGNAGVFASQTGPGIYVQGGPNELGVDANASGTSANAIYGAGTSGAAGVVGSSDSGTAGYFSTSGSGSALAAVSTSGVGVYATSQSATGGQFSSTGGSGVLGLSTANGYSGVSASSSGTGSAIFAEAPEAPGLIVYSSNSNPIVIQDDSSNHNLLMYLDSTGNLHLHGKVFTGAKMTAGTADATFDGESQLTNGTDVVAFDEATTQTLGGASSYLVTVTPEGNSHGVYVTRRTPWGFTVRENAGGRATVAFAYHVVAHAQNVGLPHVPLMHSVYNRITPRAALRPAHR